MIRHVKEIQPTLDNIVVLSLTSVDEDKLRLKECVVASLNRLEKETLISKSGDTFYFLTNEEQEINREIKNIDVERHKIIQEIYEKVFNSNDICLKSYGEYKFNKSVDDKLTTSPDADLTIRFLSELSDDYSRGSGQQSFAGQNLSNSEYKDTLLFVFPENSLFIEQITAYLQIDLYLKQKSSNRNDELIQKVIMEKGQESAKLKDLSVSEICEGVKNSRVFIDGVEVVIASGTPKERVKEGYEKLVKNVYSKSDYVTKDYESETDIIRLLKSDDLEKYGVGKSETNNNALNEMLSYISIKDEKKFTVVLSELRNHFMKKPYGWNSNTISGLVATLYMSEDIKLRYQKTYLSSDPEEITKYLTRKENYDKVIIEIRKKTGIEIINNVKTVLRDLYDTNCLSEKETDLFETTLDILESEKRILATLSAKYSEEARYPGKTAIDNYSRLLQEISGISDPSAFLKMVSDEKDDLSRLHKEAQPSLLFFDGAQYTIFKRILGKIGNYKRNEDFLDDEAKRSLLEIEEIISSAEPYSEIKKFPQLEGKIESSLANSASNLKEEFLMGVKSYEDNLNREFKNLFDSTKIIDESVKETFGKLLEEVKKSNDCSFIKLKIANLSMLYMDAYNKIKGKIPQKPVDKPGIIDPIKPIIVPIKTPDVWFINEISFFKTDRTIETEKDLDEYLSKLKGDLKDILKNNKIQVI
jgi:hypothetical protein